MIGASHARSRTVTGAANRRMTYALLAVLGSAIVHSAAALSPAPKVNVHGRPARSRSVYLVWHPSWVLLTVMSSPLS
jgi:hypothetical protein